MNHKRAHMISTECGRTVKLLKFVAVFAAGSTERQFVNLGLAVRFSMTRMVEATSSFYESLLERDSRARMRVIANPI
jgi:hypothetical protein